MELGLDITTILTAFGSLWLGLAVGIVIGVLPGMGPLLGIVLAIPFTYYLEPVAAIALLIGIYQGGNYGGAVAAIAIGVPGTPMAAATLLDGYPMGRLGQANRALEIALVASVFGTTFSAIALIFAAPALALIARSFGPSEVALLAVLGMVAVASLTEGSFLKGAAAALFGLSAATIGSDPLVGTPRFNMGSNDLAGGLTLVAVLMGAFAVSEVAIQIAERPRRAQEKSALRFKLERTGLGSVLKRPVNYLRSSLVGVIIGVIPGLGGVTSAYVAYKLARDRSDEPNTFGKGAEDGVVASEAANSATTGGALVPMLAVGIPGEPVVAAMMGGLLIHGLTPGPRLFVDHPEIVNGIFLMFLIGALSLYPLARALQMKVLRLIQIPFGLLMALVAGTSVLGVYLVQQYWLDLWQFVVFGVIGILFRLAGVPLSAFVLGYILGPIFEVNLRRLSIITEGDYYGFIAGRPASLVFLVFIVLALAAPIWRSAKRLRKGQIGHS